MNRMNIGRFLTWTLLAAMPLWFGSCKKDNVEGGNPVIPGGVEGSWKVSAMTLKDANKTINYLDLIKIIAGEEAVACLTDTKITFKSNGEVAGTPSPACQSTDADQYNPAKDKSTWKTTGNKLTITDSEGAETYDYTVNANTMSWTIQSQEDMDEDGQNETYTAIIEFKRI